MRLAADLTLVDGRFEEGRTVEVIDGRITGIVPLRPGEAEAPDVLRLPGKALLPGTVNTRCHTFQSLLRGLGDDPDLMQWRDRVLYPCSARLDREGIHLGAAFAFTEMLIHGVTTCTDFFHLQDEGNENAEAVIRAAHDVGIRLVLARAMYDWEGASPRYREDPGAAARRVGELIREADLVAVDLAHPSLHPPTNLLTNVVYAMSPQAVTDVWVHGRRVVKSQRLTTLDQGALMERVRALTRDCRAA